MAEMAFEPAFPGEEVERLRDERMNDLLQAWSDPRRRAERVFPETVFAPQTPLQPAVGGYPDRPSVRSTATLSQRVTSSWLMRRPPRWSLPET